MKSIIITTIIIIIEYYLQLNVTGIFIVNYYVNYKNNVFYNNCFIHCRLP